MFLSKKIRQRFSKLLPMTTAFLFGVIITILVFQVINIKKDHKGAKTTPPKVDQFCQDEIEKQEETPKRARAIDGIFVDEHEIDFYPMAVMIENNVMARPQSGLNSANLVIESPVEGGITRFLAIFADGEEVKNIGPIRSARPYFLDWTQEYDALYAHVGGSPEALKEIKNNYQIYNLNQYFQSKYYWRSSKRERPHNVYSSCDLLFQAVSDMKLKEPDFGIWKFKDDLILEERPEITEDIVIDFSTYINRAEWRYERENNEYIRYQAGKLHLTADDSEIKAKNIIIQKTSVVSIDKEDRKKIKTIGSGEAIIFLDGGIIEGSWEKSGIKKRTRFYNKNGEEIEFNRGTTWIEVVGESIDLRY